MKTFMASLVCSILLLLSFAYGDQQVVYVNGIQNKRSDAIDGKDEMQLRLNTSPGFEYTAELVYNPIGWYGDSGEEADCVSFNQHTCIQDQVEIFHLKSAEEQFIASSDLDMLDFWGFTQPHHSFDSIDKSIMATYAEYFDDLSKSVLPSNSLSDEIESLQALWSTAHNELNEQRVRYENILNAYRDAKQEHANARDAYNALEPTDPGYDDAEQAYAEAQVTLQEQIERAQYTYGDVLYSLNIWSDDINAITYHQTGVDLETKLETYRSGNVPEEMVIDEYVKDFQWSYYINLLDVVSPVLPEEMFAKMQESANFLYRKIQGNAKTVLVAHSQGNLLANLAYAKTASEYGDEVWEKLRVVNVANISELAPNNLVFTGEKDGRVFGNYSVKDIATRNGWSRTTNRCQATVCEFIPHDFTLYSLAGGHSFVDTYLSETERVTPTGLSEVMFRHDTDTYAERFVDVVDAATASFPERVQKSIGFSNFALSGSGCYEDWGDVCYKIYDSDIIYAPYNHVHIDMSYGIIEEAGSYGYDSFHISFGEGQYVEFHLDEYGASIGYTGGSWEWVDDVGSPESAFRYVDIDYEGDVGAFSLTVKDGHSNELLQYVGTFGVKGPIDTVHASVYYDWSTGNGASYDLDLRSIAVSAISYDVYREVIAEEVLKEPFDDMLCPDGARECLVLEDSYYQSDEVSVFANGVRAEFDYYLDTQGGTRDGFSLELGGRYIAAYTKPDESGTYALYTCPVQRYNDDYCAVSDEIIIVPDMSAYTGAWNTGIIEYDMKTHVYTIDLDGDGTPEYTHTFPFVFAERNTTARAWAYSWSDIGVGKLLLDEIRIRVLD